MEKLPFLPSQIYNRRRDIHHLYGGNWQSGITPSRAYPYIFIFSGKSGKQHGYQDGWDNPNVFTYTGEGQLGDMTFSSGNLALRDHHVNGKRVFLFESVGNGFVRFEGELELFDHEYFETNDRLSQMRLGIKFFFKRKGATIPVDYKLLEQPMVTSDPAEEYQLKLPNFTERKGLVTSRVGQGVYRKRIIHRWEYQCAVTGFDNLNVLIASHILPWAESTDDERLDIHNGILLSPDYDALFDKHLISFENNGKIILSNAVEVRAFDKIGVTGTERISKELTFENHRYLEIHRNKLVLE
jgi:5-methylcytosine-specific restriction enzyme A